MFAALGSIRIILLVGPKVPVPAPVAFLSALKSAEVDCGGQNGDGFQLSFALNKSAAGEFDLLASGVVDIEARVILGVLLGGQPEKLIDGIITHHQLAPGTRPGEATLTVMGRDVSLMLDLEEKDHSFQNQSDSQIVQSILKEYVEYIQPPYDGITQTSETPNASDRIPSQHGSDLQYIRSLGSGHGYVFYIEPSTMATNSVYWGPKEYKTDVQPPLLVNQGPRSNVTQLSFSYDALSGVGTRTYIVEPNSKTSISVPEIPFQHSPALAAHPGRTLRYERMRDSGNLNSTQAGEAAKAASANSPDPVTGQGEVDSVQYWHVLRPRRLDSLIGAGQTYNGLYRVNRVTHHIASGSYRQGFEISREGTGALF